MQFIKTNEFRLSPEQKSKSTLMASKQTKRAEKIKIITCCFCLQIQTLTCGLSDGTIIQYSPKKFNKKKLTESQDYQTKKFNNFAGIHKGQIKCLLNQKIFNQFFIISGSADRTIKIWDIDPKSKDIVQTLTGHTGTILCLSYSKKSDTIFSGSTDKTFKIWKQDQSRKFFMYPWFVCYQSINEFHNKKLQIPIFPTAIDIHDGQVNNFELYLGDSIGNLHVLKQIQIFDSNYQLQRSAFQINKSNFGYHRLNICAILYVSQEHLIVTASYDQHIYAYQSLSDKVIIKYQNPKKCIFTSLVWYEGMIVAGDQDGTLYCIQINTDKGIQQIKKYNTKIHNLVSIHGRPDIFVITDQGVDSVRIVKGIKAVEGQNCHKGPIIAMFSIQAYKLTQNKVKDQAKIVSVSLDNTMRVWDPTDLSPLQRLPNPQKTQITCLFYLKRANLFVTGHDNGAVRLWNIQLQTSITISQENSPYAHTSTISTFTQYIHNRNKQQVAQFLFSTGYQGKVNVWQIFLKKSSVQSSLMSSTICPQLKFSFFPDDTQESADQIGYQLFALDIWRNPYEQEATILSGGTKGMVYFTRMFSYQTYRKIKVHNDSINCMLIDQNILFTSGFEGQIKLTSLQNFQQLISLQAHQQPVTHLFMLEQTGHLVSKSAQGDILFWNYPQAKVVKKIKQKKQKILSFCIVDQIQMLYMGTQDAKVLSCSLKDVFANHVNRGATSIQVEHLSEEQLKNILQKNDAEIYKLLNDK